jgi:hypothetical protein
MCDFFKTTFSMLLGGALSAATGLWLFSVQRRLDAKDEFMATIDDLRARLDVLRDKPEIFYSESVEVLRRGVYKVRRSLGKKQRIRLHEIFRDYINQKKWFESPERTVAFKVDKKISPDAALDGFLDRFYGCVNAM